MTSKRTAPTPVRLPPELHAWIREQAERNHRSLNGEIVARLEQSRLEQSRLQEEAHHGQ